MSSIAIGLDTFIGSAPFTPRVVATLWWRSDLGVTQVAGPKVSAWVDQIEGLSLAQGTDAKRPTYTAIDATYNNKPTIVTDASTYLVSAVRALAQPCSIFIIGENDTPGGTIFAGGTSAETRPIIFNSSMQINAGSTLSSGDAISAPSAMLAVFDGGTSFVDANGWLSGGVPGAAGAGAVNTWSFGAYSGGDFGGAAHIAEIVVLNRAATATDKTYLAAYFTARYGLVIS